MRLLVFTLLLSWAAHAQQRVLITGFEPFAGHQQNTSELVARALGEAPRDGVIYTTCILPVTYREAAERARECYEQMDPKPDMVLSTGEMGDRQNCAIRVETRAYNMDDNTLEDNNNEVRESQVILDKLSPSVLLDYPSLDMFCATNARASMNMAASTDVGSFVCNNLSFQLANYFQVHGVPFGFIHLPRIEDRCQHLSAQDVTANFHQMVLAGLRALPSPEQPGGYCGPVNPTQLERLAQQTQDATRQLCMREFLQQVRDGIHRAGPPAPPAK